MVVKPEAKSFKEAVASEDKDGSAKEKDKENIEETEIDNDDVSSDEGSPIVRCYSDGAMKQSRVLPGKP